MEMGVDGPVIVETKLSKGYMGKLYPNYTRWLKKLVVVLHIHGPRAIFILFCNYHDTESESCEMKISVDKPISNHKRSKDVWGNDIHTTQDWRKILW